MQRLQFSTCGPQARSTRAAATVMITPPASATSMSPPTAGSAGCAAGSTVPTGFGRARRFPAAVRGPVSTAPGFGRGERGGRARWRGHGPFGGRGSRRRGNVRAAILALLTERPMHGYEMIQELDQRTGGVWRPSPGSVYPTLQLLEDEGLIAPETTGGRKAYSLTEAGQAEATAAAENAPWAEFSAETVSSGHDTREAIAGIMMALKQIGFERNHRAVVASR